MLSFAVVIVIIDVTIAVDNACGQNYEHTKKTQSQSSDCDKNHNLSAAVVFAIGNFVTYQAK